MQETPDARKHVPKNSSKNRAKFGHNSGTIRAKFGQNSGKIGRFRVFARFSPDFCPNCARILPEIYPIFARILPEFCPTFLTPFFGTAASPQLAWMSLDRESAQKPGQQLGHPSGFASRCPDSPTLKSEGMLPTARKVWARGGST